MISKLDYSYGELLPDRIIDTFYKLIKDKIELGENYDRYIKNLLYLNGGKMPIKIKNLIEG